MIKKILITIVTLIIGLITSYLLEGYFREQIQRIFKWATSDHIKIIGKNFYIFSGLFYYISFAVSFAAFGILNFNQSFKRIIINGLIGIFIFILSIIGISSFDANLKVIECTACQDGIRKLQWNEINYDLILGISALLFTIPSLVWILKKQRKSQRTTTVNRQ